MEALEDGLEAVMDNSQYKAYVQVAVFQNTTLQCFKARWETVLAQVKDELNDFIIDFP